MSLGGTAWVDRNMRAVWDRLRERVPESWLPRTVPGKRIVVEELGCGHYGCVMPTGEDNLVCKLTSDPSEASFVSAYLSMNVSPNDESYAGIVRYEAIYQIADASHRGRPVYLLWRQEAEGIGFLINAPYQKNSPYIKPHQTRAAIEGEKALNLFLRHARTARDGIQRMLKRGDREEVLERAWGAFDRGPRHADPRHLRGIERIGAALQICYELTQEIANTDVVYQIGSTLNHFMDEGLLLADVHLNNIGIIRSEIFGDNAAITDPGHVIAFHPKWTHWPGIEVL